MPQAAVTVSIYNTNGRLIECIKRHSDAHLSWRHEMLDGVRTLDLTQELQAFINSGAPSDKQNHSLFCSYLKFGDMQQERVDFTVVFKRCS